MLIEDSDRTWHELGRALEQQRTEPNSLRLALVRAVLAAAVHRSRSDYVALLHRSASPLVPPEFASSDEEIAHFAQLREAASRDEAGLLPPDFRPA